MIPTNILKLPNRFRFEVNKIKPVSLQYWSADKISTNSYSWFWFISTLASLMAVTRGTQYSHRVNAIRFPFQQSVNTCQRSMNGQHRRLIFQWDGLIMFINHEISDSGAEEEKQARRSFFLIISNDRPKLRNFNSHFTRHANDLLLCAAIVLFSCNGFEQNDHFKPFV